MPLYSVFSILLNQLYTIITSYTLPQCMMYITFPNPLLLPNPNPSNPKPPNPNPPNPNPPNPKPPNSNPPNPKPPNPKPPNSLGTRHVLCSCCAFTKHEGI